MEPSPTILGWFPSPRLGTLGLQAPAWLFIRKLELQRPHAQAGAWEREKYELAHGEVAILIMSQSADRQPVIPAWMPESSHKDVNLGVAIKPFFKHLRNRHVTVRGTGFRHPCRNDGNGAIMRIAVGWLERDILALAGTSLEDRRELFDFIVEDLARREHLDSARIRPVRPVRVALKRQRDKLLGFAGVLDGKIAAIAQCFDVTGYHVRAVCLLLRKPETSLAYWQRREQLNRLLGWKFHGILEAVSDAMDETHRSSSMAENLNGRLRNYFFLRRHLGQGYLDLLRFFLNHRTFARSERPERVGKSPAELMTGKPHPHWLELLGFERFRRSPVPA